MSRCKGTTREGVRCQKYANGDFCHLHVNQAMDSDEESTLSSSRTAGASGTASAARTARTARTASAASAARTARTASAAIAASAARTARTARTASAASAASAARTARTASDDGTASGTTSDELTEAAYECLAGNARASEFKARFYAKTLATTAAEYARANDRKDQEIKKLKAEVASSSRICFATANEVDELHEHITTDKEAKKELDKFMVDFAKHVRDGSVDYDAVFNEMSARFAEPWLTARNSST
jgi:hypothetical protein